MQFEINLPQDVRIPQGHHRLYPQKGVAGANSGQGQRLLGRKIK